MRTFHYLWLHRLRCHFAAWEDPLLLHNHWFRFPWLLTTNEDIDVVPIWVVVLFKQVKFVFIGLSFSREHSLFFLQFVPYLPHCIHKPEIPYTLWALALWTLKWKFMNLKPPKPFLKTNQFSFKLTCFRKAIYEYIKSVCCWSVIRSCTGKSDAWNVSDQVKCKVKVKLLLWGSGVIEHSI